MAYLSDLHTYLTAFRTEAKRCGAYKPDAPAEPFARMVRAFLDAEVPVDEAVAWYALGLGPSVARTLRALGFTPAAAGAYIDRMRALTSRLVGLDLVAEWMVAGVVVDDAAAWAALGFLPSEAAPLIAGDVTPETARAMSDAAVAADDGPDGHLAAQILRLAADDPNLVVDPDLARTIFSDSPEADR